MKRITRALWCSGLLVAALGLACEDQGEIGSPLSVTLTGPGTGPVGQALPFHYEVRGRSLSGIILEWGDGGRDSIRTAGAQRADGNPVHTFDSVGVYTVNMIVEDAIEGVGTAQVTVDVASN